MAGLLLVTGLVVADQVRAARSRETAALDLSVTAAVAAARPPGRAAAAGPVQDAVVALTVRNSGPYGLTVLEQELDGGGPVDAGPALAARASAVLDVRWRVLCGEVGTLFGPQELQLVVRTRSRAVRQVSLPLGPPTGLVRRTFHAAAVDACGPA